MTQRERRDGRPDAMPQCSTLNIGPYSEAINRAARFRTASSVNNV